MAAYHIGALPEEQFHNRCVTRSCSQVDGPIPQLTHGILHAKKDAWCGMCLGQKLTNKILTKIRATTMPETNACT